MSKSSATWRNEPDATVTVTGFKEAGLPGVATTSLMMYFPGGRGTRKLPSLPEVVRAISFPPTSFTATVAAIGLAGQFAVGETTGH